MKHYRLFLLVAGISLATLLPAQNRHEEERGDVNHLNPIPAFRELHRDTTLNIKQKLRQSGGIIKRFIKAFDEYDTTYIEPNKYNMSAMLQGTGTSEWFSLKGEETGHSLKFSSIPSYKIGPYLGWHWIFLGYGMDVHKSGKAKTVKHEFELSLYSSMLGCDLMYRKTGSDFTLRRASGYDQSLDDYKGETLDGISVNMIGINMYLILNHRHFSLPAAFSQSTRQIRSAGSWKFGVSVTRHTINIDYDELNEQIPGGMSADMEVANMRYMDYSLSAGYAYNWVFKKNWLFSIGITPSIGYKRTSRNLWIAEDNEEEKKEMKIFYKSLYQRGNINFDVTGRMALVWNNATNYAGTSIVLHNFNYRYKELSMHDTFITWTLYVGMNFWRKKKQLIINN